MTKRAAIYVRISKDREGAGLGVERQEQDCRELAAHLGASVTKVYADNDLSAYSGKPRPEYRALLDAIEAGEIDIVLVWHTDRLHRSPVELEQWISVCEPRGVAVHTVKAGPLDLATPSGKLVARQLGAVARYEVEHMIERQRSAKAQAAAAGRWRGGVRPYGFEKDGVTVRESEAAVIRETTERILLGESLRSLARDLNAREITTSTGRAWTALSLRNVVLRARNAGLIENDGRVVGPAQWPEIVEPAVWRNVTRILTAPGRRAPFTRRGWLGSGLYECGVCDDGSTMVGAASRVRRGPNAQVPAYRCRNGSHLTRIAGPLDEFVSEIVIERLSRDDARLLLAPQDRRVDVEALEAQREDVAGRMTEAAGMYAVKAITGPQLVEVTRTLQAEADALDAQIAAARGVSPLAGIADADDVREAWEAANMDRRRAVVRALMGVTLLPARKGRPPGWRPGGGYFDPSAVRIEWVDGAEPA